MKEQIIYFILILLLNIVSSSLANLKTIFLTKQSGKITYFVTLIDATMYSLVLKSFSSSGYLSIIAYVLGKLVGIFVAEKIENKLAIGIIDVKLYVGSEEKMELIQESLIDNGFSSTAQIGYIDKNTKRYSLNIQLQRKSLKELKSLLSILGIEDPTMVIQDVKRVSGKISERIE